MQIGIDARLYGNKHTGIGRYTRNLILALAQADRKNTYVIFGNQDIKSEIESLKKFKFVKLNTPIYSFAEQIINPFIFARAKLDLLHVPHFNAPIFYPGKLVITIHDLIKHISTGKESTTRSPQVYWIKQLAYRFAVAINIRKAKIIITPSKFWKDNLVNNYNLNPQKVHVTYEAVDKALKVDVKIKPSHIFKKYNLRKPFVIYTGNLYPHKNINFLVSAIKNFNKIHKHQLTLAIVCARSVFENKINKNNHVHYLGFVPDNDLAVLYSQALALVHPSLIEGFGLTGLEAMAAGLPVLSSDATCLPEVYSNAALYFDPYNQKSLILRLEQIMGDREVLKNLKAKGFLRVKRFSWTKTARETIKAYKSL
ncbi:glycosyltransferase family 4 protein [Patescibacteria group bacterium]|nr:glycosyltransferase family 4 protein [Patescibacteria group bacterium]